MNILLKNTLGIGRLRQGALLKLLSFNLDSNFVISSQKIIKSGISLPTVAVGRETAVGANDAPTQAIAYTGLCHPSIEYVANGWNGWKYWKGFTPYFSPFSDDTFENPTIMVSNDGLTWQEPVGISNPIDRPSAAPSAGYWSDVNIALGSDGYMNLWYRGNYMTFGGVAYTRFVVHRKSSDGVNWSAATLVYSTSDAGVANDNQLLSPSFIEINRTWNVWDVIIKSVTGGFAPVGNSTNNQTNKFVVRRTSQYADHGFSAYSTDNVINFVNRPWGENRDPWHIEVKKFNGLYFMLISVGTLAGSVSDALWLAISNDGLNFKVCSRAVIETLNYKSTMVFKGGNSNYVDLDIYAGNTLGEIAIHNIRIENELKVTVSTETPAELTAYNNALSAAGYTLSQPYFDGLKTYINSMKSIGQWDSIIEFQPLIGATIQQQAIKLKYKNGHQSALLHESISNANVDGGLGLIFSPRVASYPPALNTQYLVSDILLDGGGGIISYIKLSGTPVNYKSIYGGLGGGIVEYQSTDLTIRDLACGSTFTSPAIGNGPYIFSTKYIIINSIIKERKSFKDGVIHSFTNTPATVSVSDGTISHLIGATGNGARGMYGFEGQIRLLIVHNGKLVNELSSQINALTVNLITALGKTFI